MNPDPHPTSHLTAKSLGLIALETLASGATATVIGSTSRGLFLLAPGSRVVFLSYESWRSPLTINLGVVYPKLRGLAVGAEAQLSSSAVFFPAAGAAVDLSAAPVWSAPACPKAQPTDQRMTILQETAKQVTLKSNSGLGCLLAPMLRLTTISPLDSVEKNLFERLEGLQLALAIGDTVSAVSLAAEWVGYGQGLTPSGDDLIAGFLLAGNRWRHALHTAHSLSDPNSALVDHAYANTTTLSACIIAAAAAGEADERLIGALDGIMSGSLSPPEIAALLLSYGNSSGIDAFLGMALAILSTHSQ